MSDGRAPRGPAAGTLGQPAPGAASDPLVVPRAQRDERARHLAALGRRRVEVRIECDQRRVGIAELRHQRAELYDGVAEAPEVAHDETLRLSLGDLGAHGAEPADRASGPDPRR